MPPRELMFTMRPPPVFRISRAPCWQQKNTALRFTEWMKSQSGFGDFERVEAGEARGVVHQAVEAAAALLDFGEHAVDFRHAFEVGAEQFGAAALLGGSARLGFRAVVMDGHARAFARQAQGDAAADALGRAGDQHDLAGQGTRLLGSPWTSISSGSTPSRAGSGSRPVKCAQPQNIAVVELSAPATAPMVRGSQYCEAMPASIIEIIMTDQVVDSMVANTRPRNSSGTCRSSCDMFSTELNADARARERDEHQRPAEAAHLAEQDVRAAVHHVADRRWCACSRRS